jgi:SHS2 domain-containing protein
VSISEFDRTNFRIKAALYGEEFQIGKHPQGTEVKAITYSNMQVHENEGKCEVFVIIDI